MCTCVYRDECSYIYKYLYFCIKKKLCILLCSAQLRVTPMQVIAATGSKNILPAKTKRGPDVLEASHGCSLSATDIARSIGVSD
jgi:hypothetical protein